MKRAHLIFAALISSAVVATVLLAACGEPPPAAAPAKAAPGVPIPVAAVFPEEKHLADVRQLTLSGENAEAYWAFDGRQLILQSRGTGDNECDRIHRMPLNGIVPAPANGSRGNIPTLIPVSSGKGATTCSYFLPGNATDPYPIGIEGSGVVETAGPAVAAHHPGDRVAFVSSMQPKGGTWAEFVAVRAGSLIVAIPASMSFVEAAALPVAGNTVLRALRALGPAPGSLFIAADTGIGPFYLGAGLGEGGERALYLFLGRP